MNIAFSPCPNDTFVFHAWVHGLIPDAPLPSVTYADIDITNRLATTTTGPDILKISAAALPWVLEEYQLIPCGGALGRGCGPLVLVAGDDRYLKDPRSLTNRRIAVPSERSTAYLLFRLWVDKHVPEGVGEIHIMPFNEIMPAVQNGTIDAGLVIHEARFTYPSYGLSQLVDLGDWWEQATDLPIPLGVIIARRSLHSATITQWIRDSVDYAWAHPQASQAYVLDHAQELDPDVVQSHIELYVNDFTRELGQEGYAALDQLLISAADKGLVPAFAPQALH